MARPYRNPSSTPARNSNIPSPGGSDISDKENQPDPTTATRDKGKGRMPPLGQLPTPTSASTSASHSSKRRRTDPSGNARRPSNHGDENDDELGARKYYNPDQDPEERQVLKRKSRALERRFNDNRDEYLNTGNKGLEDTINEANTLFEGVKQTSDATLDSRLMVNVSDLLSKKSAQMLLGDTSTGLDVDDFVSKCISFMRMDHAHVGPQDDDGSLSATQSRRRRQQHHRSNRHDDDEDQDGADYLDWVALGSRAAFPSNLRPPVPGFLLGPLSVQKKARTQTQRRARQARDTGGKEVRPEALTQHDLGQSDTNNLTAICSKIRAKLQRHCDRADEAVTRAGELSDELMREYRIGETGGPHLFDFVIDPFSFGQTVENIFHVSFLIKEGNVGLAMDSDGLPTLVPVGSDVPETEKQDKRSKKHQAVFSIDFATWKKLIRAFDIKEPLIEHRVEQPDGGNTQQQQQQQQQIGSRGWYS